jgi:hypothetical protein
MWATSNDNTVYIPAPEGYAEGAEGNDSEPNSFKQIFDKNIVIPNWERHQAILTVMRNDFLNDVD